MSVDGFPTPEDAAAPPRPALDPSAIAEITRTGAATRQRRTTSRTRAALGVSIGVTVSWLVYVTVAGHWGRVTDNWVSSVTMVFGSFVAGSTPQGGGAVAFPVFTKLLEVPSDVARTFSLCIQTVGMGCATASILIRRREISVRAIAHVLPAAFVGFMAMLFLGSDGDTPFWSPLLPGPYVKVTFTLVLAAMGFVIWLASKLPLRAIVTRVPAGPRPAALMITVGLIGGAVSALVGSGTDVMLYVGVVVLLAVDTRIAIPTSVICMASVSVLGFVMLGIVDGQLDIALNGAGDVAAIGGTPLPDPLPADRFDLFGLWIAAVPIVAWGAPLGSAVSARMTNRALVRLVVFLAAAEVLSTAIFLTELHTDPALLLYAIVAGVFVIGGLWLLSKHRVAIFDLPRVDPGESVTRASIETGDDYGNRLRGD